MTPRERVIRILIKILARPKHLTRKQLMEEFGIGKDAINDYIKALYAADIGLTQEEKPPYRFSILPDARLKELQHLRPLTEEDRAVISHALYHCKDTKTAEYLNAKIASLYDFQKLGLRALRRPMLEKIDNLAAAKQQKKQVWLKSYRSNKSKTSRDRLVEPHDINPELDMIQVYEVEKQKNTHFRLSRMDRVEMTDQYWQFEQEHRFKYADVFRIADDNKVLVQLRLDLMGYNQLIDTFPTAQGKIMPDTQEGYYEFQDQVNHNFYGLTPFLLAYWDHVEIISPQELKDHIRLTAKKISAKF